MKNILFTLLVLLSLNLVTANENLTKDLELLSTPQEVNTPTPIIGCWVWRTCG